MDMKSEDVEGIFQDAASEGRAVGTTTFDSAADLAAALRRAAAAHGEHESRIGAEDPDWPAWYAEYMVSEKAGREPPS
jgi:hypothetical protein